MFQKVPDRVIEMANDLIRQHHDSLLQARIGFVARNEPMKRQGKYVFAQASTVSAKLQVYAELDFIIWIAYDVIDGWPTEQLQALIDHQLCHCVFDEIEWKASLRAHDVEEFGEVIERWGAWNYDLLRFQEKSKQLSFTILPKREEARGAVMALDPEAMA